MIEKCFACGANINPVKVFCGCGVPYASFYFNGEIIRLSKQQYEQRLADSKKCSCGSCLVCRCAEYERETK